MCGDSKLPESDPRSTDSRPLGIFSSWDDEDEDDYLTECERVGHEWVVKTEGFYPSWGRFHITSEWDECTRCGKRENYWESPLGP